MPMNGGGTSSRVPGAAPAPNQTIKSADYNSEIDDIYGIFNTARPIAYGGTGASTADGAATSLEVVRFGGAQSLSASQKEQARDNIGAIAALKGHLYGLTLSNNTTDATNDIDIAAGEAASDGSDPVLMTLASALTKRLDAAWAVGSGNGGLDTGSVADGTYHVWLIQRSDTGVVDALFSTSATSPTMPANYDRKCRIGSVIRTSGAILPFVQDGDNFHLSTPVQNTSDTNPGTSAVLKTLAGVPAGLSVEAKIIAITNNVNTSVVAYGYFSSPLVPDQTPSTVLAQTSRVGQQSGAVIVSTVPLTILTNTSRQIRFRYNFSPDGLNVTIINLGWVDKRGRT